MTDLPYRPCVGVTLINRHGLIFAGRRLDSTADAWQMPQGGIDEGEKPRAAALRELEEETGVKADRVKFLAKTHHWLTYDLPPELLGRVWGGKYRGQRQKWFLFRFDGADDEVDITKEHPEFSAWRWIGAEELLANIVPFKREVYGQVVASFRAYLACGGRVPVWVGPGLGGPRFGWGGGLLVPPPRAGSRARDARPAFVRHPVPTAPQR